MNNLLPAIFFIGLFASLAISITTAIELNKIQSDYYAEPVEISPEEKAVQDACYKRVQDVYGQSNFTTYFIDDAGRCITYVTQEIK